jgi:predicted short-subunit dehydrogenase-like oxidoreductase (DUF2520 family)
MKLGIVGGGRAAWAFGSAWRSLGRPLAGIASRSHTPVASLLDAPQLELVTLLARSEVLLIAVSDSSLQQVAQTVRASVQPSTPLFHPSGSQTSDVFAPHSLRFSLHPLQSLPPAGQPATFKHTLFTFEGAAEARPLAQQFVSAVGGRFAEISGDRKPLYHAAAVFASNYVEALLEIAQQILEESGIDQDVQGELAGLARSAIDNWLHDEFTGPLARGDQATIDLHLRALAHDPKRAELYRMLAESLAKTLESKGFRR